MKTKYFTNKNEKFGNWTILNPNIKSRSLSRCICGEERLVRNSDLIAGRTKSCGKKICGNDFSNLLEMRFGFLIVKEKTEQRYNNGSIIWKCECICKNIINVSSKHLISGSTKSCGCKRIELKIKTQGLLNEEQCAIRRILYAYKNSAKNRNLSFELTVEQFINLINKNCHYCGSLPDKTIVIKRTFDTVIYYYNGIDRKNSKLGYMIENCVPCCWICNRAKLNMEYKDFIKWINKLKTYSIVINESTES